MYITELTQLPQMLLEFIGIYLREYIPDSLENIRVAVSQILYM